MIQYIGPEDDDNMTEEPSDKELLEIENSVDDILSVDELLDIDDDIDFAGQESREIRQTTSLKGVGQYHNPAQRQEPPYLM